MINFRSLIICCLVLMVFLCDLLAAILYVNVDGRLAEAPYNRKFMAATDIQSAVDAASDGDTVIVMDGIYYPESQIVINKAITVRSENGAKYTIVDGCRSHRCFYLETDLCKIQGLTIKNGFSMDYGGGVGCSYYYNALGIISFVEGVVDNCVFVGNESYEGGGMCGGIVSNSTFVGNSALLSGGGASYVSAYRCTVVANNAFYEGGARGNTSHCIIWDNTSRFGYVDKGRFFDCAPGSYYGAYGCITDDPLMVSSSHIASESSCVGMGSEDCALGADLDGDLWQNPPSIGRDEPDDIPDGDIQLDIVNLPAKIETGRSIECVALVIGDVTRVTLDFGDGTVFTNELSWIEKDWGAPGEYSVVLTAYNNDYPAGISYIRIVEVGAFEDVAVYVSTDGNDANSGTSWSTAKATIQGALESQSQLYRSVLVNDGVYCLDSEIFLKKGDIIRSVNGPQHTVIDGCGSHRCFHVFGMDCDIEGFTIRNGFIPTTGGGVCFESYVDELGNTLVFSDGTVSNCVFKGNVARDGGGLSWGTAKHCVFIGNTATYGGGCYNSTVYSCGFSGNSAVGGGGICNTLAYNCTITDNVADYGGGVYLGSSKNCIVWHNTATAEAGNIFSIGMDYFHYTCSPDVMHGENGCITNDPLLVSHSHIPASSPCVGAGSSLYLNYDAANEDFRVCPGSPCIDAGNSVYPRLDFDLYGNPRVLDGDADGTAVVDMGCYEFFNPLGDSDGDTMTDYWELSHGLNILGADGNGNNDSDPFSNIDEFIADTDPNSSNEWFRITSVSNGVETTISFKSSSDRVYTLLGKTNLHDAVWMELLGPRQGIGGADCFDVSDSVDRMFYKLKVELP